MQQDTMQCLEMMILIFDLELDKFGVETMALKAAEIERVFQAWVEECVLGLLANLKQHARLSEACLVEATSDNNLSIEHNSMSN
jgi:hypothetical protein